MGNFAMQMNKEVMPGNGIRQKSKEDHLVEEGNELMEVREFESTKGCRFLCAGLVVHLLEFVFIRWCSIGGLEDSKWKEERIFKGHRSANSF